MTLGTMAFLLGFLWEKNPSVDGVDIQGSGILVRKAWEEAWPRLDLCRSHSMMIHVLTQSWSREEIAVSLLIAYLVKSKPWSRNLKVLCCLFPG